MKTFSLRMMVLAPALLLCGTVFAAPTAAVTVTFTDPAKYTDMPLAQWEKDEVMQDLNRYLVGLGTKWLPAGQSLKIEVLDIDLAGRIRYGTTRDLRVLTGGADWPMIEVRYTLEADGKTLKSATERIADMDYMHSHVQKASLARESLYYEKAMLEDWFKAKFASQAH